MKWSILILSIPERIKLLGGLLNKLEAQLGFLQTKEVEILVLTDNKSKSIAEKRNNLLSLAKGDYISFLDDDDDISKIFIESIMKVLHSNEKPDCVTFDQSCLIDGKPLSVSFGVNNPHEGLNMDASGCYLPIKRPPYHMCIFKKEIAQNQNFREVWAENGQSIEDIDWLLRLYPKLKSEHHINKTLHYYLYCSKSSRSVVK